MKRGVLITILVVIVIFLILAFIGGFIYLQFTQEPHVPDNVYLQINLSGKVLDIETSPIGNSLTVKDLWYHLNRAKIDKRIKGLVLKISYLNCGLAITNEMGDLINDFKESGKEVTAFIESAGLNEYYLASFADRIYASRSSQVFLTGLVAEAMFLKDTFSKLGIVADFINIGEYKTAAHMFTEDGFTEPHRESLEKLVSDIHQTTIAEIAANRHIDPDKVNKIVQESPVAVSDYLKAGLIDKILFEDEMLQDLTAAARIVSFSIYSSTSRPRPFQGKNKIAVIFASGEINSGESSGQSLTGGTVIGSDTLARQLRRMRKSSTVKAVILRVDSPGGSALASEVIRREAELLAAEKPLIISMAELAASGGYLISMPATSIFAHPQTITGSIGVVGGKFVLKGLYDKVGLKKSFVKTSPYADIYSDYRPFTAREKEKIMEQMLLIYRDFKQTVASGRDMPVDEVDQVARGRVWAGKSALSLGLVDHLGGLGDALTEAKKQAGISSDEAVGIWIYPRKKSVFELIVNLLSGGGIKSVELDLFERVARYRTFFPAPMLPYLIKIR